MTPSERLIQESCRLAANDLDLPIVSPFVLMGTDGKTLPFIALFERFGSDRGVLICMADDWLAKNSIATELGYFCSGLHPNSYSEYDRRLWIESFEEWGWRGREGD